MDFVPAMPSFSKCQYCQKKKMEIISRHGLWGRCFGGSEVSGNWLPHTLEASTFPVTLYLGTWTAREPTWTQSSGLKRCPAFHGQGQTSSSWNFYLNARHSNWVPLIKFLPIVEVEAGVDRLVGVCGADGRAWAWREASPTGPEEIWGEAFGCWQAVQPARQNTRSREHRAVQKKSEFLAGTGHWGGRVEEV